MPDDNALARAIARITQLEKDVRQIGNIAVGGAVLFDSKLTVAASSFTVPVVRQEYKVLTIMGSLRSAKAGATDEVLCQINGLGGANYDYQRTYAFAAVTAAAEALGAVSWAIAYAPAGTAGANLWGTFRMNIFDYGDTTKQPSYQSEAFLAYGNLSGNLLVLKYGGKYRGAGATTSLLIYNTSASNFNIGSWIRVYGDKG